MAEVNKELIYRALVQIRDGLGSARDKTSDINGQLQALNSHVVAVRQDLRNIHAILTRHDARLDHIEWRLEIAEVG